jgi:hypothetical protein
MNIINSNYLTDQERDNFIQWLKDTGKMQYKSTNVFIIKDEQVSIEQRMAWVSTTTTDDWREYCNQTGTINKFLTI